MWSMSGRLHLRVRGGGVGTRYLKLSSPLGYLSTCSSASGVSGAPLSRRGMPSPSRTGTSSTSTRSTCWAPAGSRITATAEKPDIPPGRGAEGSDVWTRLDPHHRHPWMFLWMSVREKT